ncbi:Outer membrane protein [Candidatus Terasakiella magnetica]|nr:Outer membrane protein [Candidatus Terasakiella magnetica]
MTRTRRDFLLRFASTTLGTSCVGFASLTVGCVYGPPPPPRPDLEVAIPGPPPSVSADDFVAVAGDKIFFDFDRTTLNADAKSILDRQIAWLKMHPEFTIRLEGHTDNRGTREYCLPLSERMAGVVKEYMVSSGISPRRVLAVGYGRERPVDHGDTETAQARNRRVVVNVSPPGPSNK